jgi:hypothetical protein
MHPDIQSFFPLIKGIVFDISTRNYNKVENERVSAEDIKRVIEEYGSCIIPLPDNAFDFLESYYIEVEKRWDIYLPLWTEEEGRSDLTLSLSCYIREFDTYIEIDDLHVL